MSDYLQTLDGMFDAAWTRLEQGALARAQIVFATTSVDGYPEARTVVLRHVDRNARLIDTYTDIQSDKIASLRKLPRAAIHLWDADLKLQLRLQADVRITTGAQTDAMWAGVPDHARQSYGVVPAPGTVIDGPTNYTKPSTQEQFAVLRCTIRTLDVVSLADPHRRACFRSQSGEWSANWLAP